MLAKKRRGINGPNSRMLSPNKTQQEQNRKRVGYHGSGSSIEELLNDPASLAIDKSPQCLNCHA